MSINQRKKVVFVIQYFDTVGGAETQIIRQMPYFLDGFAVKIVTQGTIAPNKFVHTIQFFFYCIRVLFLSITSDSNTVFYFVGAGFEKVLFHFANRVRPGKIRYIVKFPGTFDEQFVDLYQQRLKKWKWKMCHDFFLKSSFIIIQDTISIKYMKPFFPGMEDRIVLIRNGIPLECPYQEKKMKNPVHILFVGRIIQEKGVPLLVEAARRLRERCVFHFVGDGPHRVSMEMQATGLANVHFHGHCSQEALQKNYYPQADIFVLPSAREGLPNVVLEAMSHSIPVIATDVGALPEIFENNRDIVFLPKESLDQDQVVEAIERLLSDQDFREHLARNAYKKLQSSFDIQRAASENIALIEGL